MPKYTTEELGELGENELHRLALLEQLVATPVKRDVRGYDFVVEFTETASSPAADLAPATRRVFVQVKASQTLRPSCKIKLSNWQKMVLDPSPWFVLFVQLDGNGRVASTSLRHIDEELQSRALKALRTCTDQLNRRTLKLAGRRTDRLRVGKLREALERAVGNWESYPQTKKDFTSNVGYEHGGHILRLTFEEKPNDGHIREWVDAALGLPVRLLAKRAERIDNRFSIPVPISDFGPVFLEMNPAGTPGQLRIIPEAADGRLPVTLKTQVFSTALNPNIPEKHSRARFSSGPLDFFIDLQPSVLTDGSSHLRLQTSWNYDRSSRLADIIRAARAFLLMSGGASTLSFSVEGPSPHDSPIGRMSKVSLPNEKVSELRVLASLSAVADTFNLSDTFVSSGELVDNLLPLAQIGVLLSGDPSDITMRIGMTEKATNPDQDVAAVIVCPRATFSNVTLTTVAAFLGELNLLSDCRTLDFAPSSVRVFRTFDSPIEHKVAVEYVLKFSSLLESEGYFVVRPTEYLDSGSSDPPQLNPKDAV